MSETALSLAGLFAWSFFAASILPLASEPALVAAQQAGWSPVWLLLLVASSGNTLGACANWWLGRYVEHFRDRRWFPVTPAQLEKASERFRRYGGWSLLLSWLPVIGDPLTFAAGLLRYPFWRFLLLVGLAKTARYAVVLGLADALLH